MSEAARQRALLAAIGHGRAEAGPALRDTPARAARGLAAYRANAQALAHRALAAACPTVEAMVGADQLPGLAWAFWQAHPPACGDLAEWGSALPDWLAARPDLADWPWLADAARLDLALHHGERAADAELDAASLVRLGEHDPARLQLQLMPGTAVLCSVYPIVSLRAAHQAGGEGGLSGEALQRARNRLAAGESEQALVWRRGWRCEVMAISPADAGFTGLLLSGHSLDEALSRADPALDFGAWLQLALRLGWVKGVALRPD